VKISFPLAPTVADTPHVPDCAVPHVFTADTVPEYDIVHPEPNASWKIYGETVPPVVDPVVEVAAFPVVEVVAALPVVVVVDLAVVVVDLAVVVVVDLAVVVVVDLAVVVVAAFPVVVVLVLAVVEPAERVGKTA